VKQTLKQAMRPPSKAGHSSVMLRDVTALYAECGVKVQKTWTGNNTIRNLSKVTGSMYNTFCNCTPVHMYMYYALVGPRARKLCLGAARLTIADGHSALLILFGGSFAKNVCNVDLATHLCESLTSHCFPHLQIQVSVNLGPDITLHILSSTL